MTAQISGLKHKVHTDFYDFIPGFEKQANEYKKAILHDYEGRFNKKKGKSELEEQLTHPYMPSTDERFYEKFVEVVVNEKTKMFFPAKDEDNRAIPNTGAYFTVSSIVRLKRQDGSEFLLSKGNINAFYVLEEPQTFYVPYREKWQKTIDKYTTEIDPRTKQFEKILEGPSRVEEVYDLPYTKENLTELWNQRESDLIQLVVKDEKHGGGARSVRDVTGSAQRSYELFRDSDFDYLYNSNYIEPAIKEELRMKAVSEGWIRGGAADYTSTAARQASNTTGKSVYK